MMSRFWPRCRSVVHVQADIEDPEHPLPLVVAGETARLVEEGPDHAELALAAGVVGLPLHLVVEVDVVVHLRDLFPDVRGVDGLLDHPVLGEDHQLVQVGVGVVSSAIWSRWRMWPLRWCRRCCRSRP
jgi:hypothetical protein